MIHTVIGFGIVNKAEIDVFLELSCFFNDHTIVIIWVMKIFFVQFLECSNYCTIALISHTSKVVLKNLQARLQQYMNHELPDVQAGFRKGRGTRDQIPDVCWIIGKARECQKKHLFCFIDYAKAYDCVDHNKLWKII